MGIAWYILLFLGFTALFALISGGFLRGQRSPPGNSSDNAEIKSYPCPVCGSRLKKGQRIRSVVYPGRESFKGVSPLPAGGIGYDDRIVYIYGCPYCYPGNSNIKRICPVCKKEMAEGGYLMGRMWNRRGKNHLHVQGCNTCNAGR